MEKELKVANKLPGSPHITCEFITNSFKSEVSDGAISGQHQTCGTSYIVNIRFLILILNIIFPLLFAVFLGH